MSVEANFAPANIRFEPGKKPGGALASWADYRPLPGITEGSRAESIIAMRSSIDARPATSFHTMAAPDANQLEAQLFDARANAKLAVSSLAMHLDNDWRAKINKQVDALLSVEDWDSSEALLQPTSMRTFLRFVIFADVKQVPSLGMSPAGFILGAWRKDTRRLTIEFMPGDRCRLAISHFAGDDDSIVTFAGASTSARGFIDQQNFSLG